jgi:D-arabinose 1-dehydrogenase-like Zn-dependent alcohol dehydrogenase
MVFKQTSILGSAQNDVGDLVDMLNLVASGKVKPKLEMYRMDEINRVFVRLAEGKVRHRAVLMHEA